MLLKKKRKYVFIYFLGFSVVQDMYLYMCDDIALYLRICDYMCIYVYTHIPTFL